MTIFYGNLDEYVDECKDKDTILNTNLHQLSTSINRGDV